MKPTSPLARGVFTLLGDTQPGETQTPRQLLAARQALTPQEYPNLETARSEARFWLNHPNRPGAPRKLASSLRTYCEIYGAGFARTNTPLPVTALI